MSQQEHIDRFTGIDFWWPYVADVLHRQALGMVQHHSINLFESIAARFPLHDIPTLEDLADELFSI